MTTKVVGDDRIKPTDEQLTAYLRREHELRDRFLKGVRDPTETLRGMQILIERDFSRNLMQDLSGLTVTIPALPKPSIEEVRGRWSWIDHIAIDASTTSEVTVDFSQTVVVDKIGEQYDLSGLKLVGNLGYQHGLWIMQHSEYWPRLLKFFANVSLVLKGQVLRNPDGFSSPVLIIDNGVLDFRTQRLYNDLRIMH